MSYTKNSNGPSGSTACFTPDFASARAAFREKVKVADGRLELLELGAKGPNGESLTIDIAWFGSEKPRRVFVHSSGLHGVEAFAGSALQLQWLDGGLPPLPEDGAIVLVHVLNPYGMAWLRRFNENNIDLNRNFRNADEYLAEPVPNWKAVNGLLNPSGPPRRDWFYLRAALLLLRYGFRNLKQTVAGGQRLNPQGLFFVGCALEEGPAKFQAFLEHRLADAERIVAIDIHTGLGHFGEDRLLVDAAPERSADSQTMRAVFGDRVELMDSHGVAYRAPGAQHDMYYRLFPQAKVYFASQEFGTYNSIRVLEALRAENRLHNHGSGTVRHPAKTRLLGMFNPCDPKWRLAVLKRGEEVIRQACELAFRN